MANNGQALHLKNFTQGTHRSRRPEETLMLVTPFLESAGITRVAVVTGLDTLGIPVTMVTRPMGRSLSVTQGKGLTTTLAKVSGLMEAIEQFHAETIDKPLRYASYAELKPERAVDITHLIIEGQGASHDFPLLWVQGASLTDGLPAWVPFELVHLDYRLPLPAGSGRFLASSNGLASGNCLGEATCHALFEVVERHQAELFYGRDVPSQASRRVDLSSVDDPACRALLELVVTARVSVAVWDLSEPLGIPCFLCDLVDEHPDVFRPLSRARGLGCHSSKGVALSRSITEAAQSRLTNIAGSRDDISTSGLCHASNIVNWQTAIRQHTHATQELCYGTIPSFQFDSFEEEQEWLVGRLTHAGFNEGVVVDLSKPDWPVTVVRVVVPGLLHFGPSGRGGSAS